MCKILLVDDDEELLLSLSEYLESSGYTILKAENGKEALELITQYSDEIALLITDIRMPIIGGVELCRRVREIPKLKYLPILILTTMTDISDKYIGFSSGADDYLTKPFINLELLLRIQSLLKRNLGREEVETTQTSVSVKIDKNKHIVLVRNKEVYLSPLEFDILFYLFNNSDKLISVEEIFINVFKYPPDTGNPDTIRAHIKNIRSKIEEKPNEPKLITNIPKKGYIFNSNS